MTITKRLLLVGGLIALVSAGPLQAAGEKVTVYKSPTCGCCEKWVGHMRDNGFEVETIDMADLRMVKSMSGVTPPLASCHTAKVGGYVVEGHVPADDIKRLLRERPDVKGLAAPGMPQGSPGMESAHPEHFKVLTFDADGHTQVFAQH